MSKEQKNQDTVHDNHQDDVLDSSSNNQDSQSESEQHSSTALPRNRRSKRRNYRSSRETRPTDESSDSIKANADTTQHEEPVNANISAHDTDTNADTNMDSLETEEQPQGEDHTPDSSQETVTTPPKKQSGQTLTYLALLIALGGIGLGGFAYYKGILAQDQYRTAMTQTATNDKTTIAALQSELSTLQNTVKNLQTQAEKSANTNQESLQGQLSVVAQKHDALNQTLSDSAKGLQSQIDHLKEVQQSLVEQGKSIDNIATVSQQAITIANNFDKKLAEQALEQSVVMNEAKTLISTIKNITDLEMLRTTEVDYLLKVAIQKVRFDKDYPAASDLLSSALARLNQINSINFSETKALLSDNIKSLQALKPIDLVTVTTRLEKIAALIQHAPLKDDRTLMNLKKEIFNQSQPEGETWTDKLVSSMRHLIVIEDKRTEVPELMAKEDRFFLSQNIQLELTAAKVALLQDQYSIFDHSLKTVQSWIKTYFDEDNADVREAIQQLQWLLDAPLEITPPNIERTFTDFEATLRAYKGA